MNLRKLLTTDWITLFFDKSEIKMKSGSKKTKERIENKSNRDKVSYYKPKFRNPFKKKNRLSY